MEKALPFCLLALESVSRRVSFPHKYFFNSVALQKIILVYPLKS